MLLNESPLNAAALNELYGGQVRSLAASVFATAVVSAPLRRETNFEGALVDVADVSASAGLDKNLAVAGAATVGTISYISLGFSLSGTLSATSSAAGLHSLGFSLEGSPQVAATVNALISKVATLDGIADISASYTADIGVTTNLESTAVVGSAATANLSKDSIQYAEANTSCSDVGDVEITKNLAVSASGSASATGYILVDYVVAGALDAIVISEVELYKESTQSGDVDAGGVSVAQVGLFKNLGLNAEATAETTGEGYVTKVASAEALSVAQISAAVSLINPLAALDVVATAATSAEAHLSVNMAFEGSVTAQTSSVAFVTKNMECAGVASAATDAEAYVVKWIDAYADVAATTIAEAAVDKNMAFAGAATATFDVAPVSVTKNMAFAGLTSASTTSAAAVTKVMAFTATSEVFTDATAAITKNMAFSASATATTSAIIELRKNLAASVTVPAFGAGNIILSKPISGAGDEVTTVVAEVAVKVNMEGMSDSFALSSSTIHLTKSAQGYSMAVAVVVDARLRKLFLYSTAAAEAVVSEVTNTSTVEDVSMYADVEGVGMVAELETVVIQELKRVA